jgi:uncharacterized protein (TIGR03437 family)
MNRLFLAACWLTSLPVLAQTTPPALLVSPSAVSLTYQPGSFFPAQNLSLTSSGGVISFIATTGEPWLSFLQSAGTTPATLTVLVNPSTLATGTYSGSVRITAPGASNPSVTIPVTVTILPAFQQPPYLLSVSNSASYAAAAGPGGGIAQGSLFVAFGFALGPQSLVQSGYPLGTTLAGTSIRITVGSASTDALMVYTSPGQIAAILPSKTPVGSGLATVTYNGQTSSPLPVTIAPSSFGTYSVSSNGLGPGVITGADFRLKTSNSPAKPAEIVILWGTGLGAIPGDESNRPAAENRFTPKVFVGNQPATVLYAGRSSCCTGLDQINLIVPAGVQGCFVPVAVQNGAVVSNFTTLPISNSAATCSDTVGFDSGLLSQAASGLSANFGVVAVGPVPILQYLGFPFDQNAAHRLSAKLGVTVASSDVRRILRAQASERRAVMAELMKKYGIHTPAQIRAVRAILHEVAGDDRQGVAVAFEGLTTVAAIAPQFAADFPPSGTCTVFSNLPTTAPGAGPRSFPLDAGNALSFASSAGTMQLGKVKNGQYQLLLGAGTSLLGNYRVSGTGGKDIGTFAASLNVSNTLEWLNKTAVSTIDRTQPLTITWAGGPTPGHILLGGFADVPGGAAFLCVEDSQKGILTVPSYVLSALPQTPEHRGYMFLSAHPFENTFSAPGIDRGYFANFSSDSREVQFH